jgi:succinate dehydrogenase / fumarate reductase cytochrome b subunit
MPTRPRPLSPFLHYRWQYTNTLSILHRVTGIGLSIAFVFLVYLIAAVASGPQAFARAAMLFAHPLVRSLLALAAIPFAYHMCNGVRHLLWDAGLGLERIQARRSAWIVVLATLILSAAVAVIILLRRGGAA